MRYRTVFILPLFLCGCGLPPAFTVASLIADGVSLAASQKTIGDHALSFVADKDCAMWRMVDGNDICRTLPAPAVAVAAPASVAAARPELVEMPPQASAMPPAPKG